MRNKPLFLPYPLGLRDRRHEVRVLKPDGAKHAVLGTSQPLEDDRRAAVYRQWGLQAQSPRQPPPPAIDTPLPQRSQTILSHQVSELTRAELNGGATPTNNQPNANDPVPRTEPLGQPGETPQSVITVIGPSISVRLGR
ncbi:hypothetical protein GCM10007860_21330 [Chitiniphilus shinanonensis]|uniref:Uncharacterized protein n=1 Tax=Chitiniphilus shinanonensis TaxID=553088 RepID=A0ABQ6BU28_9NEIS|nr:hypothetical protein [Chitiniphilus shinanonensis]GLS04984.1 hypothetical protein GCM10007860_21330 [Chitiniphilus shinanonensis]